MGRSRQSAQTSGSVGERKNGSAEWQEEQILTWALDTISREGSGAASCSEGIGVVRRRERQDHAATTNTCYRWQTT